MINFKIRKAHSSKFQNSGELFKAIKIIWNYVPKQEIENLISSMKRRCQVIKNNR